MVFSLTLLFSTYGTIQQEKSTNVIIEAKVKEESMPVPEGYRSLLAAKCMLYEVPEDIAASLIAVESGWCAQAISKPNGDGSIDFGLCQLNSLYINYFSLKYRNGIAFDPLDAEASIDVGLHHLSTLKKITNNWKKALVAYNAGLSRVQLGTAPSSSWEFAKKVLGESSVVK